MALRLLRCSSVEQNHPVGFTGKGGFSCPKSAQNVDKSLDLPILSKTSTILLARVTKTFIYGTFCPPYPTYDYRSLRDYPASAGLPLFKGEAADRKICDCPRTQSILCSGRRSRRERPLADC